jgi:hypothetical protein
MGALTSFELTMFTKADAAAMKKGQTSSGGHGRKVGPQSGGYEENGRKK